jgi:hypothetical protein
MKTRKRGNGSIYQQPGCLTWTISFYGYNGRRIREATGTEDYRAAQQKLREKLVAIGRGEPVEPRRRREVLMSELYDGLARHYRVNGRKSLDAVQRRWLLHLKPIFGEMPARNLTHDLLNKYIDRRQAEKAASATINRELAALKTMLRLGLRDHKLTVPLFPHLVEDNVRTGFVEQSGFDKLCKLATELWLRLFLEMAFTYGWRKKQFLTLRVRQVNLLTNSIRLDVGTTKNKDGLEVAVTETIRELVKLAVAGKGPDDHLLTRATGQPVKDFRKTWHKLSVQAGLGSMVCRECGKVVIGKKCECGGKRVKYVGLILHDFRRSAARELRRAGVPESTIMDIGGWKTREMFKRYAITDTKDVAAAISKRERARVENGHDLSHDLESSGAPTTNDSNRIIN